MLLLVSNPCQSQALHSAAADSRRALGRGRGVVERYLALVSVLRVRQHVGRQVDILELLQRNGLACSSRTTGFRSNRAVQSNLQTFKAACMAALPCSLCISTFDTAAKY